jgi:hypothetical protein
MNIRIVTSVLIGTLIPVLVGNAADFVHPRLKAKEETIKQVVMLPPIVELSKKGVKGREGMGKEAEEATADLSMNVVKALKDRGLAVDTPFTEEAIKDNDQLKYAVADVQRKFDEIAGQLYKKHKDVRKGRFTLGDSVGVLNTKGNAECLVIVRADGTKETAAKAFMGGGIIGAATSKNPLFASRVALVDAKNGDILFLGDYLSKGLPKDKTYEKSFKSIPVTQ